MTYTADNIKYLRKLNGWSQGKLAEILGGIDKSTIHHWESGRNMPQIIHLQNMAKMWNTTIDNILNTDMVSTGLTLGLRSTGKKVQVNKDLVQVTRQNNLLVPISAQAGYLNEWPDIDYDKEATYIDIPGIDGEARTFEIEGDSMYPILEHGDYIVCRRVESLAAIKDKSIYVVISSQSGISAKYLRLEVDGIMLIPANQDEFRPVLHPSDDIKEIWEAQVRITSKFMSPTMLIDRHRLGDIEAFLSKNFPDFKQEKKDSSQ